MVQVTLQSFVNNLEKRSKETVFFIFSNFKGSPAENKSKLGNYWKLTWNTSYIFYFKLVFFTLKLPLVLFIFYRNDLDLCWLFCFWWNWKAVINAKGWITRKSFNRFFLIRNKAGKEPWVYNQNLVKHRFSLLNFFKRGWDSQKTFLKNLRYTNIYASFEKFLVNNWLKLLKKISNDKVIHCTKMKSSNNDFFSKCYQIRKKLRIWSHLLKKSLMENFIFCAVVFGAALSGLSHA